MMMIIIIIIMITIIIIIIIIIRFFFTPVHELPVRRSLFIIAQHFGRVRNKS